MTTSAGGGVPGGSLGGGVGVGRGVTVGVGVGDAVAVGDDVAVAVGAGATVVAGAGIDTDGVGEAVMTAVGGALVGDGDSTGGIATHALARSSEPAMTIPARRVPMATLPEVASRLL
jgi:hypothetical protein